MTIESAAELQALLHRQVPISAAMGITVESLAPDRLVLQAPLSLNHNHCDQGFAGSIYALASLSGWAMLRYLTAREGVEALLLLGEGRIRYHRPLNEDLRVEVVLPPAQQQAAIARLRAGSNVRLPLELAIPPGPEPAAVFSGTYFAKPA